MQTVLVDLYILSDFLVFFIQTNKTCHVVARVSTIRERSVVVRHCGRVCTLPATM